MIIKNNIPKLYRNKKTVTNPSNTIINSGSVIIGGTVNVIDNLVTNSPSEALSAKQGMILNDIKLSKSSIKDNLSSDSDIDALSARLGKMLNDSKLSKTSEDTAKEKITFKKGLVTDGDIKSSEYSADKGLGLYKDYSGNWNLEIDNIKARKRFNVQDLKIDEAKYIGGALYCTMASMKVSKVTTNQTGYRLFFKKENADGVSVGNKFLVGDLALCQTFNNNQVKRWWREVLKIGLDFIDISLQSCEAGSGYPMIGDEVILFGSKSNPARLGAIVIEPLALKVYDNINSFKIPEPLIRLSPKDTKIDADLINFLGKTIINDKFIVSENGDVTMNNANVSGDLKVRTFRMYANQVDSKGILTSSFINMSGDYVLPLLLPDEVRTVKIFMGRPSRTVTAPVHFSIENSNVSIDVQSANEIKTNLTNYDIYDSMWLAYGFGGINKTVWLFYLEKQFI